MVDLLPLDHPLVPEAGAQDYIIRGPLRHRRTAWGGRLKPRYSRQAVYCNHEHSLKEEATGCALTARDRLRAGQEIEW